jgi:hypothetical protein
MKARPQSPRLAAALAGLLALPAFAHVSASATPHLHDGDGWGVLVVVALTALAAWLDRRRR